MKIALVAAVARNNIIGADNKLLWRMKDDFRWFKQVTMNKPMIMGRKTFESIGKALPGRDSIVLTRNPAFLASGCYVVRSLRAALKLAEGCAASRNENEICVIGGGDLYAQTLSRADRIYLTRVDAEPDGDTQFPAIDSRDWMEKSVSSCTESEENQHACEFFILDRRR